jgi:cysteine desulfurase family protein (TIGR01976 family)
MSTATLDIADVRSRFSSLKEGFAFFDAPGGTQVPDEVGDAIARALREASANLYAPYATSHRVHAILEEAERRSAAFLGCEPEEIVFGSNMTTLNFMLTRTASRDWAEGDEILVSDLDHDGNVAPWLEVARDRGFVVRHVAVREDTTLDLDDLRAKLSDRTRVVAFSYASNAVGTIAQAAEVVELAHGAGALAWIDAVHYAAHEPVDVAELGCDVLLCSAYKWCGPHLGIGFVSSAVAETWRPYKARPAASTPRGRSLATGTLAYEMLAGLIATYEYLDSVGGFAAIRPYERGLGQRFLDGLPSAARVYGMPGLEGRVPTFLLTLDGVDSASIPPRLAERGYGVWAHDSWYSLGLYQGLGYEGDAIRVGMAHYNSEEEVDGLLAELGALAAAA